MMNYIYPNIHIVFDGPPSHESGRFVEVELDSGHSVCRGEWIERSPNEKGIVYWDLVMPDYVALQRSIGLYKSMQDSQVQHINSLKEELAHEKSVSKFRYDEIVKLKEEHHILIEQYALENERLKEVIKIKNTELAKYMTTNA